MAQGRWNITIDTPMGDKAGVLELNVNGATVTGSLFDADHRVEITHGRIDGNHLSWQARISKPMRLSVKFTAVVDRDRISGEARHMLGTARFAGTRNTGVGP